MNQEERKLSRAICITEDLGGFEKFHEIALEIFQASFNEVKTMSTAIGISEDKMGWSFFPARSRERVIKECACSAICNDEFSCNYWTLQTTSFLRERCPHSTLENNVCPMNHPRYRVKTKPGKLIGKIFEERGKTISADKIAEIVRLWDKWNSKEKPQYTLKFLKGQDIQWAYLQDHYGTSMKGMRNGSLWCSCMRGKESQSCLKFYADNSNIELAVLMVETDNPPLVYARSLVWNHDCYDRIYAVDNYTEDVLVEELVQAGLWDVYNDDEGTEEQVIVKLDSCGIDKYPSGYPYFDTMQYMDEKRMILSQEYVSPYGGKPVECSECGKTIYARDEDISQDRDYACYSTITEKYYCRDCCVFASHYDTYIPDNISIESAHDGFILKEDAVYNEQGGALLRDGPNTIALWDGTFTCTCSSVVRLTVGKYHGMYARCDDSRLMKTDTGRYTIRERGE